MSDATLPIEIDKGRSVPIYVQLEEAIRLLIHRGALRPGDPLPTVRKLAVDLGINANTVARVYRELSRDGLLRLERGVGTFVAEAAGEPITKREFQALEKKVGEVVGLARRAGLTVAELTWFIHSRWKEET